MCVSYDKQSDEPGDIRDACLDMILPTVKYGGHQVSEGKGMT